MVQHVARIGLVPDRQDHPLLALGTVEIARGMPRTRVDQGLAPVHVLDAGRDVHPEAGPGATRVVVVENRVLNVDGHAAERVDDVLEALEVDHHVVLDVEPVELTEDRLDGVEAARLVGSRERVGAVARIEPEAVDLAAVRRTEDGPGGAGRDRHVHGVPRQAEHRDLLGRRVDRDHDQGVGVERAFLGPLIGADEQDVEAVLAVPLGQRGCGQRCAQRWRAGRRRSRAFTRLEAGLAGWAGSVGRRVAFVRA